MGVKYWLNRVAQDLLRIVVRGSSYFEQSEARFDVSSSSPQFLISVILSKFKKVDTDVQINLENAVE
jgi:hypothetical protein